MEATKNMWSIHWLLFWLCGVMLSYTNAWSTNSFLGTSVLLADMACAFLLPENLCYAICCLQKLILKIEKQKLFTTQPDSTRLSVLSAETAWPPRRMRAAWSVGAAGRTSFRVCVLGCGTAGFPRRSHPIKRNWQSRQQESPLVMPCFLNFRNLFLQ